MPKLLILDQPAPVNLPNASPGAFGAGVGSAMQETGRVGQALGQALQQYADSGAKKSAAQYEQALSAEAEKLSLDPDIQGRSSKFDAVQRRLQEQYRPKLGARSTYDAAAGFAATEIRTRFDHKTTLDGIEESRRNVEMTASHKAMKAAVAETDEEVATLFLEIQNDLKAGQLYLTPAQQDQMFRASVGSGIRAMADANPKRALRFIDQAGTMLPPEVLSVYRSQAMTNLRQAASIEASAYDLERKLRIQAEADASREAENRLLDLDRSGTLTMEHVKAEAGLSPTAYARMKKLATVGRTENADPDTYVALEEAAHAGSDVVEEANDAYTEGKITQSQRDSIVGTSRDERFDTAKSLIRESLDPGAFTSDRSMRQKRANATQSFNVWQRANPEATAEQAHTKAVEIIRAATIKLPKLQMMGRRVETQEDIAKLASDIERQLQSGIIDQAEAQQRSTMLRQISDELNARASVQDSLGGGE